MRLTRKNTRVFFEREGGRGDYKRGLTSWNFHSCSIPQNMFSNLQISSLVFVIVLLMALVCICQSGPIEDDERNNHSGTIGSALEATMNNKITTTNLMAAVNKPLLKQQFHKQLLKQKLNKQLSKQRKAFTIKTNHFEINNFWITHIFILVPSNKIHPSGNGDMSNKI